jgi:hypothetical protein
MKFTTSLPSLLHLLAIGACWMASNNHPYSLFADAIQVGESFPPGASLHFGFPPDVVPLSDRLRGRKVLLVGLPGAFTPT